MAYGTKYFADYKSGNVVRTVQLQLDGYAGAATEWFCSIQAPEDEQGNTDKLFGETVVGMAVRLEFLFQENYDLTEFVAEPRTYKLVILEGATVKFEGFLEQYETYRDYQRPGYFVSMRATCGLNRLVKNVFEQTEFNEANLMLNYFEILQRCLDTLGIPRVMRVSLHVYQNSSLSAPNPLGSCEVDIFRYFTDSRWMDAQSVIVDILNHFNAQIFIDNNIWVVRSVVDHAEGFTGYIEYPAGGGAGTIFPSWPNLIRDINYENTGDDLGEAASLDGGQVGITPRIRKWTIQADLGGTKEQFTNSGLQLWDVNGPIGWVGNMPEALGGFGWSKAETGLEGSPYALHIRGRAPHPYFKLKKKGIWPFRKTVVVPIEPATYWETPEIEISKTDESLTIGFEYYTDDDSAGFFYAVVLHRSNPVEGEVNWAYVKSGSEAFPYDDEFTMMLAPPHPKVNPETGITQAKGSITFNLNLTQLNSAYLTNPDKPIFDRAEIWFYYSNDDSTKTGDEYWIYKVIGDKVVKAEAQVPDGDSRYKVILESNPYESDEGDKVDFITGDYAAGFLGTTMKYGVSPPDMVPTGGWTRRGRSESISIYRAVAADRLGMTYEVGDVIETNIKMFDEEEIRYVHLLRFLDRSPTRLYKIVRYKFNHYTRIATVLCVEATYVEPPTIKQRSYTDARGLLDEDTEGDGIYPGTGNASGRVGADEEDAFGEPEPTEEQITNARTGVFEDVPALIYTVSERSTSVVHLKKFLSTGFIDSEEGVEGAEIDPEDQFDPEDFVLTPVSMPSWVETVEIDKLSVYVTAKPTVVGEFALTLSVVNDEFGQVPNVVVPIIVYPPIKVKYVLRDTSGLDPVEVAEIVNGKGLEKPEFDFDIKVTITGRHDGWYGKLTTPDDVINQTPDPYALVEPVDESTYIIGEEVLAQIGFYQIDLGVYRNEGEEDNLRRAKFERIKFSFYDEETLAKAKFYLVGAESGQVFGPIKPDGSSAFENIKEPWDVKMEIFDVLHDGGVSVLGSEVGDLDTKQIIIPEAVEEGVYFQFDDVRDEFDPSTYNILLTLNLADPLTGEPEPQYVRAISFTINHKPVQPTSGVLELGSIPANTTNFDVIMELAGTGNSVALPTDGWSVRNKAVSAPFNSDEWVLYKYVGSELVNIDISAYTGNPQTNAYAATGITEIDSRLFGLLTSLQIGNPSIHKTPSTFRVINRRRMDGVIVAVYQADFSFGPAVPIDEAPIGGPSTGTGGIVLEAGNGIFIAKDDEYNTVNVIANSLQFEFDSDPLAKTMNLKPGGVTLPLLAELPSLSVIGNMTAGPATPAAISVITSPTLAGASNSNLGSLLAIKTYIDNTLTTVISGTVDFFAKFATATTIAVGTMYQSGTAVINSGHFISDQIADVNVRGTYLRTGGVSRWGVGKAGAEPGSGNVGSDWVLWSFSDTGVLIGEAVKVTRSTRLMSLFGTLTVGGSGVVISTTSTTLNPNFNADLLDSQHGVWYLDRTNHTGTQLAATISDFAAAVRAVPLTGLSIVTGSPIVATDTILQAFGKLQGQVNTAISSISGTVNYYARFSGAGTTIGNGLMNDNGVRVFVNGTMQIGPTANPKIVIADDASNTYIHFADATPTSLGWINGQATRMSFAAGGTEVFRINYSTQDVTFAKAITIVSATAPIITASTVLNVNLNADLLDDQHGAYYLSRANHTGTQLASTISNFSTTVLGTVLTGLSTATNSPILATDTILQAFGKLQAQVTGIGGTIGTGTVDYFAKYTGTTTLGIGGMYASGTAVINGGHFINDTPHNVNVTGFYMRASGVARWGMGKAGSETGANAGSDWVLWAFDDAGTYNGEALRLYRATKLLSLFGTLTIGGSGVVISTTSTTLNPNFNADLLDSQHGTYYLSRANHTGTQAISTVTGLQTALDGKVGNWGNGLDNRFALWINSGQSIGNSNLYYNGGNIGVGVNPGYPFQVNGAMFTNAQIISSLATGTKPFDVTSTTLCNNLNADMVDGLHASAFATASHTHIIAEVIGLQAALDIRPTGSGTLDRYVLWTSGSTQTAGNIYNNGGNVGIGMVPGYQLDVNGSIRYNNQLASTVASGTKPIDVTSTTLCTNLNADLLDGQHASAFAAASHTHTSSQITDFTSAARGTISGTGSISYNSSTGVISFTGSTGLSGSGTNGYAAFWNGSSSLTTSTVTDNGSEINFASGRSFGVEGPAAMRDRLHVWGYQANGTASNHGTLILHNLSSATINGAAAIEILSTTRGFLNARMTRAQRLAISSVPGGLQVYQTDTVGASLEGLKVFINGVGWSHVETNTASA